jgi:hypothetical protein
MNLVRGPLSRATKEVDPARDPSPEAPVQRLCRYISRGFIDMRYWYVRIHESVWQIENRKPACARNSVQAGESDLMRNSSKEAAPRGRPHTFQPTGITRLRVSPRRNFTLRERLATAVLLYFPEAILKGFQQDNGFFVCMGFRGLLLSNWQRSEPSF